MESTHGSELNIKVSFQYLVAYGNQARFFDAYIIIDKFKAIDAELGMQPFDFIDHAPRTMVTETAPHQAIKSIKVTIERTAEACGQGAATLISCCLGLSYEE